jgi:hypothetical protein
MNLVRPFCALRIAPSYVGGFSYSWEMSGGFNDPGPWEFVIQKGPTDNGPWEDISPKLVNVIAWKDEGGKHLGGKSNTLYFRVKLTTPRGVYYSPVMQPYGDLNRRDFLLAREIIRREALRARVLAGVECDVYIRSTFGPKCPHCLDPVTGEVRDSHCRYCFGTGRYPAYFGPHRMMLSFSTDAAHHKTSSNAGTQETRIFEALAIGNPVLKHGDVIIDVRQDKRYLIGTASVTSEVRRIACLQNLSFEEAPVSDVIYRIGESVSDYDDDEECDE